MSSETAQVDPPSETDPTVDPIHEECVAKLRALSRENGARRIALRHSQEEIARLKGVEDAFVRLTDALAKQRAMQP